MQHHTAIAQVIEMSMKAVYFAHWCLIFFVNPGYIKKIYIVYCKHKIIIALILVIYCKQPVLHIKIELNCLHLVFVVVFKLM